MVMKANVCVRLKSESAKYESNSSNSASDAAECIYDVSDGQSLTVKMKMMR